MKKKLIVIGIFIVLVSIIFLFTNLYKLFLKPLDIGIDIQQSYGDVILVLGGGLRSGGKIGFSTGERLDLAVQLYKEKKRRIILSDGSLYKRSPAIKKMKQYLLDHHVDDSHIHFEGQGQTTFESCKNSMRIIEDQNYKQVIVCTSPYHQKRSNMILTYLGYKNFMMAKMNISEIYQARTIKQRFRNLKLIFRDYFAILKFLILKN
ncbi:MAG: YdcF family protein [Candidatus Aminicenantes bacterium]|nr:YdcF family protein [Candidatus Aminicenantes bacterium]